jgi:hypothetical protein
MNFIKDFICFWLLLQLFLIGPIMAVIHYQVQNKTYVCPSEVSNFFTGLVYPLAMFIPEPLVVTEYCNAK